MRFEDELQARLAREGEMVPLAGLDLQATVAKGRKIRRRRVAAATAAAAAMIALAVVGTSVLASDDRDHRPRPAQTDTATPTPDTRSTGERVEQGLRRWLHAIQDGDADEAWSLMTPEAQREVGRDRFDDLMRSYLPEGLGAFADTPSFHHMEVPSDESSTRVIGVLSGDVTREGATEFAAVGIPLRLLDDQVLIDEPIVDRARYYERVAVFASVSAGPFSFREGDELTVEFIDAPDIRDVFISVDDDEHPLATEFASETGSATATLDRDLSAGTHLATVVVTDGSGRLYPEVIVFEATDPDTPSDTRAEEKCSASDLEAGHTPESQERLPAPVAAMRDAIVAAALRCDYDELTRLALDGRDFFSFSFGEPDQEPGDYWRDIEEAKKRRFRDPVLRLLIQTFDLTFCTDRFDDPDGTGKVTEYVWPAASCEDPTDAQWAELEDIYSDEEISQFKEFGSFIGWRTGIYHDGDWTFYIAGD